MKFKIKVCKIGMENDFWWETYTKNIEDPFTWARETLAEFNKNLRPGENQRIFLEEAEIFPDHVFEHNWRKINLVTIIRNKKAFDTYRCELCGITSKRFGFDDNFIRDRKFESDEFKNCKGYK